jgi:hypothetical protein
MSRFQVVKSGELQSFSQFMIHSVQACLGEVDIP